MRRRSPLPLAMLLAFTVLMPAGASADLLQDPTGVLPENDLTAGLVYDGLVPSIDPLCQGGYTFLLDGLGDLCTHGPDPAPYAVDMQTADTAPVSDTQAAGAPEFVCDGDGESGFRAEAIYAYPEDGVSRYAEYLESFRVWAAEVQFEVAASSAIHDSSITPLQYRFVHGPTQADGTCEFVVHEVMLSARADDDFGTTISELKALGFNRTDRNYLIWMDASRYCGIGTLYNDSNGDPGANANNTGVAASYSRADSGCWDYAETHELMHNIGAVQDDAPNATSGFHCNDDRDIMCYRDGSANASLYVDPMCQDSFYEERLDCNGDDYFNPTPAPGSYLDVNWNTADSAWLFQADTPTNGTTDGSGGDPTDSSGGDTSEPTTTTHVVSGRLNKKHSTWTFSFDAQAGDIVVSLDDGSTALDAEAPPEGKGGGKDKSGGGGGGGDSTVWTVELVDVDGTVVGTESGTGVVTLTVADALAGPHTVIVRDGRSEFVVTVTHH